MQGPLYTRLLTQRASTCLDLGEGDLEAEALVEVGVEGVLLDRRLLLLQTLALMLQHHLDEGVWGTKQTERGVWVEPEEGMQEDREKKTQRNLHFEVCV